jgi:hypothetical protein
MALKYYPPTSDSSTNEENIAELQNDLSEALLLLSDTESTAERALSIARLP